ncbi:MAG: acylphosphatase [Candidatus Kapabacteria bacterium]|nr:acylphosphatase [Candidatus Kapabacteria bacterium]
MNEQFGIEITVLGLVQGVGFRYFIYNHAVEMGLTGFVRNLDDSVFIKAEGNKSQLEQLLALALQGPPRANVTDKKVLHKDYTGSFRDFTIK